MNLISSKQTNFKPVIEECLNSDAHNFVKYHYKFNKDLTGLIDFLDNSVNKITSDYSFFEVIDGKQLVGMFGIEKQCNVHPFFIKPEFRKKEYVKEFWKLMLNELDNVFLIGVYETNLPAIDFCEKNHGKVIYITHIDNQILLVYGFNKGDF